MDNQIQIIEKLDKQVLSVIGNNTIQGFEKAYLVAHATGELKSLLTKEYMQPIMNLQGNRLGFKTDKDKNGGYSIEIVKDCLIEAVLMGVQPVGNQFNIIAGNTYITKEGFGYLLSRTEGLWYEIIPELPRVNNTSAAIVMNVSWSINNGEKKTRKIEIPIKVNSMMGTDAIIGKATRKARAWLYNTITGCEVSDGDISDLDSKHYNASTSEFTPEQEAKYIAEINALLDEKRNLLTEEDVMNIERIIDEKEKLSYNKTIKLLKELK